MKIIVYDCRPDEQIYFENYEKAKKTTLIKTPLPPTAENIPLANGCTCASIISDTEITPGILDRMKENGIRFLSTRTIGYEHIDTAYAKKIGIAVGNITYSASSVADYAIMMMLMVLRKAKHIMIRAAGQDYGLTAIRGRELPNMTVGILGTGRIGATVARHLSGFGCRLLAHTLYPDDSLRDILTYVTPEQLYRESDILTLHLPSNDETYHVVNADVFAQMKQDAILINTARGQLVDTNALIDALESGKLSGAGLDVVEGDRPIYYRDLKYRTVPHREMAILNAMPNVLMMPHMAFYTDQAVRDMVENGLETCEQFARGETFPGLIVPPPCPFS